MWLKSGPATVYSTLKIDFDVIIYKQAFLTTYIPGNLYSNSDVSTEKNK